MKRIKLGSSVDTFKELGWETKAVQICLLILRQLHEREDFAYACLYMCIQLAFGVKYVQTMVDHIKKKKKKNGLIYHIH